MSDDAPGRPRARAAIATGDERATAAGADVLRRGGNCVDAAVAAALVLFVVEPHHCGPGGDALMLASLDDAEPLALVGAGRVAGRQQSDEGQRTITATGGPSVSVPGAVRLLVDVVRDHGTMSFAELVAPAVVLAADGFAVGASLAETVARMRPRIDGDPVLQQLYSPAGVPVVVGHRVVNEPLARLLAGVAADDGSSFYSGSIAAAIVDTVSSRGGFLTVEDLATHDTQRVDPASTTFAGSTVWQITDPTQGRAVLIALEELERRGSLEWDVVADAVAAGMVEIGFDLSRPRPPVLSTTCVAAADGTGQMVSLIVSICSPFGSGVGVRCLGGVLHNRAAGILLNRPLYGGVPPHTLIPGLVSRGERERLAIGVAGGLMQSQGQVQLLVRMLCHGLDPQEAIDAPRFRVVHDGGLAVEPGHPLAHVTTPRRLVDQPGEGGFGAAQIVAIRHDGTVAAAADGRRDGAAAIVDVARSAAPGAP
jgi:gamma-glutamyltranspeptidase/glutathione hydrolase